MVVVVVVVVVVVEVTMLGRQTTRSEVVAFRSGPTRCFLWFGGC